jgi:hypothetical protein
MDHTVAHLPELFVGLLNLKEYIKSQSTEDTGNVATKIMC